MANFTNCLCISCAKSTRCFHAIQDGCHEGKCDKCQGNLACKDPYLNRGDTYIGEDIESGCMHMQEM